MQTTRLTLGTTTLALATLFFFQNNSFAGNDASGDINCDLSVTKSIANGDVIEKLNSHVNNHIYKAKKDKYKVVTTTQVDGVNELKTQTNSAELTRADDQYTLTYNKKSEAVKMVFPKDGGDTELFLKLKETTWVNLLNDERVVDDIKLTFSGSCYYTPAAK